MISVHESGIEVSMPQGMILESRTIFFSGPESKMWMDKVGWGGTFLLRKECIRLCSGEGRNALDLALTPDAGIQATWQALLAARVDPGLVESNGVEDP